MQAPEETVEIFLPWVHVETVYEGLYARLARNPSGEAKEVFQKIAETRKQGFEQGILYFDESGYTRSRISHEGERQQVYGELKRPLYAGLRFPTKEALDEWLGRTAFCKVVFQDQGQETRHMFLLANGEILDADNFSSQKRYTGLFADMGRLKKGGRLSINSPEEPFVSLEHAYLVVEEIFYQPFKTPAQP